MNTEPNAVELTVDHAWFIAETIGAGSFPWVLAITTPYSDAAQRDAFMESQKAELMRIGGGWAGRAVEPARAAGGALPPPRPARQPRRLAARQRRAARRGLRPAQDGRCTAQRAARHV